MEAAASGLRSLLTGRDKCSVNSLPWERRMVVNSKRSAELRYLAYFGFEILPTDGFGGAERYQHQRLIGRMICVGAIRG